MFVKEIPEAEKEFPSVMLEDQELKDELKNQKQIDLEVILDFTYSSSYGRRGRRRGASKESTFIYGI